VAAGPDLPAVSLREVGFRVGGFDILSGVDLSVAEGELLGIIGPNGAGKTTLFNLLTGLLRPSAGSIALFGHDLGRSGPVERARLGIGRTFQTSSLFDALSVLENARITAHAAGGRPRSWWGRPRRDDPASEVAMEALASVGLADSAPRLAGSLSHGEKRKLELAILLASGATVLLLDEPMAGVNSEDVAVLVELISSLHDRGRTILMVEHHLAAVLGLADRVAVLHDGRLIATDLPENVMADRAVQDAYVGEPI
jgi:branched-chain amino acid transport system ATP-binding protein